MIDLSSSPLLEILKKYDNDVLKCIKETDSKSSQNYKALVFWTSYDFEIRVFVNVNENVIDIEVLLENICKNIDTSDLIMDKLIEELRVRICLIKDILETKYSVLVKADTFIGSCGAKHDIYNLEIENKIKQIYSSCKPQKLEMHNYLNEVLLFGEYGKKIADIIESLGIASHRRTRSGYLLKFNDELTSYSNTFSYAFVEKLSILGISAISTPIDILEKYWQ